MKPLSMTWPKWLELYRNNEPDESFNDSSPDMKLIRYIKKDQLLKKHFTREHPLRIMIFDKDDPWASIREKLAKDFTFRTVLMEISNGLTLETSIDEYCTRRLNGEAPDCASLLAPLACLVSDVATDPAWISYMKELFCNYVRWTVLTGVVPVAYIDRADVGRTLPEIETVISKHEIDRYKLAESRAFSRAPKHFDFESMIPVVLGRAAPRKAQQMVAQLKKLRGSLPRDQHRDVAISCLRILKQHVSGPVPFVPPMRPTQVTIALCLNNERAYVRDWLGNCYRCDSVHPPDFFVGGGLSPPIAVGFAQWTAFQNLFAHFTNSLVANTKRTVVVSERDRDTAATAGMSDFVELLEKDSQNFPKNLFDLLMGQQLSTEHRRSMADVVAGLNLAKGPTDEASAFIVSGLNTRSEAVQQKRLYDEFRNRLQAVNASADEFAAVKKLGDKILRGEVGDVTLLRPLVTNESYVLLEAMSKASSKVLPQKDVDVMALGKNNHIVHSFGATAGIADLEELMVLYYTFWDSVIGGSFGFTRRRNAINYNSAKPSEGKLDVNTQERFLALINSCGVVLEDLFAEPPSLTLTDLLILVDKVKEESIRYSLAGVIGVKSSRLVLRDAAPPELPRQSIVNSEIIQHDQSLQTKIYPNKEPRNITIKETEKPYILVT